MAFAVGDRVRVSFNLSGFFGQIGTIVAVDWKKTLPYQVDLQRRYSVFFDKDELELVAAEVPEVGDTVRVTIEGEVVDVDSPTRAVKVRTPGGETMWTRNDTVVVLSKAVKEPVVLGMGARVVEGATAPVGTLATKAGGVPVMFDGEGWVSVVAPQLRITHPDLLSSYVVVFVPPVIVSK